MTKILDKKRLPLWGILTLSVLVYVFYGDYFSLSFIQDQRENIEALKNQNPYLSAVVYALFYATATAFSLPFGTVLAVLGGFLFGALGGLLVVTIGATIGATIIFLISKRALGGVVPKRYQKTYHKVKDKFEEDSLSYLFFIRLVPLFPFAVVNILPAFFDVKTRVYVFTTFFGIIPGTFAHTYLGDAFVEVESLQGLISPQVVTAIALLGVLAVLPIAVKYFRSKYKKKGADHATKKV